MADTVFILALALGLAAFGIVVALTLPEIIADQGRGYRMVHNGTEYVQVYVLNEKGYAFVEQMLADGWQMQGNPAGRSAHHYTLVPEGSQ